MTRDELRQVVQEVLAELRQDIATAAAPADQNNLPARTDDSLSFDGKLLTERDVYAAVAKDRSRILVGKAVIVTPLARDAGRSKGVQIKRID